MSAEERATGEPRGWVRALLRVPLFFKILIANSVIVVLGAIIGTLISIRYLSGTGDDVTPIGYAALLAAGGVAVTVIVNAIILRVALDPLDALEATVSRVQAGDLDSRAPTSPLADRGLERLTSTFNGMLDTLEIYQQRLREMATRALNAAEDERKRIARELHDDTAQTLAALLIRLRVARAASAPEDRERLLDELRVELSDAQDRIRRFAHGLRPPALDELGLIPALESHVRGIAETMDREIVLRANGYVGALEPDGELALYRIAQEAISNAIRHSGAEHIAVTIEQRAGAVHVRIEDDGHGFDVDQAIAPDGRGLGIFGMRERAASVGGRLDIVSGSAGTSITVTVPVR